MWYEFDQAAKAGQIPGFKDANDLYRDSRIHGTGIAGYLDALTMISAIYEIDAARIGLPDHIKWKYNGYNDPRLNPGTCKIIAGLINKVLTTGSRVPITSWTISPTSANLMTNARQQLTVDATPFSADRSATWTTSDAKVATVSSTGVVTATGIGKATITAQSTNPSKNATCVITVNSTGVLTNFFNKCYSGTRNNYPSSAGYEFTPKANLTIAALGRPVSTTMKQDHQITIWRVSDKSVVAEATVHQPHQPMP